ncbi:tetratricopeptide repeat protein [soil metagenome]
MPGALERGRALAEGGRLDAAAAEFERLLGEAPECLDAAHDLGIVRFRQGRLDDAESCFRRILRVAPRSASSLTALGVVLEAADRLAEARDCFARVVELVPRSAEAHANLGHVLQAAGRHHAAAAAYEAAAALDPTHERAVIGRAILLAAEGRYDRGLDLTTPLADRPTAGPELVVAHARLLRHAGRIPEARERLQSLLCSLCLPRSIERAARFELADLLDTQGHYGEAFAEAKRANAIGPAQFDAAACADFVERSTRCFDDAAMTRLPRSAIATDRPVFIVGMPRSGSTLVEQIVASHSQVHAGGERNEILWFCEELARRGNYPQIVATLAAADLEEFARRYLAAMPEADSVQRVTDKMPFNFRHLGLIDRMLPGARVIHCRRHPLDTGLSCFMHGLSGPEASFAGDLTHIAAYWRAYEKLMRHWRGVLSLPMLDVAYEDLIRDPEREIRRLIEFLGLEWEAGCLRFYELKRSINTASQAQVRRPLYSTAVQRHRHYARELKPLADALVEK